MHKNLHNPRKGGLTIHRIAVNIPAQAARILASQSATSVDLYAFLELKILHELAHTWAGGGAKDYRGTPSGMGESGFIAATSVGSLAWKNAETIAYMGLLSKLVQLGFTVDHWGELHQIPAEAPGKRSFINSSRFGIDE